MYFNFLILIGLGIFYLGSYDTKIDVKEKQSKLLGSIIVFTLIAIYFFASSIPHAFKNLKSASYKEFKDNQFSSIEAPFLYHKDYLKILFELNISESKQEKFINNSVSDDIKKLIIAINKNNKENAVDGKYNIVNIYDIDEVVKILREVRQNIQFKKYHSDVSNSLLKLYSGIYYPTESYKNKKSIYRI
jgi:hypothetical protein